jgi:hypothetical protein
MKMILGFDTSASTALNGASEKAAMMGSANLIE